MGRVLRNCDFSEVDSLKRKLTERVSDEDDQIKALRIQLELKEKTIQNLKAANKALIEEVPPFPYTSSIFM